VMACVAASRVDPVVSRLVFIATLALAAAGYAMAAIAVLKVGARRAPSRAELAACLALAVAARLPFLLTRPALSDDVYRYVLDARLQRHGLNPYAALPVAPEVRRMAGDLVRRVNNPTLPTPYPPAAQWFFRVATAVGGESILAIKAALVVCDLAIAGALMIWLRRLQRPVWLALLYAWHPLAVVETAGSGHVDVLGVLLLVLALLALEREQRVLGALLFTASVLTKFLPIVLLPIVWRRVRARDRAAGLGLALLLYAPFVTPTRLSLASLMAGSVVPLGSLSTYVTQWRFNGVVFGLLERAWPSHLVLLVPMAAGLAVAAWLDASRSSVGSARVLNGRRCGSSLDCALWPLAATTLCLPAIFPWYLVWVIPFFAADAAIPMMVWSLSILAVYATVPRFGADWVLTGPVKAIEYIPVLGGIGVLGRRLLAAGGGPHVLLDQCGPGSLIRPSVRNRR
jgi:alpha-1,6-mannosyltransferase